MNGLRIPKRNDQLPATFETTRQSARGLRLDFGSSLSALSALSNAVDNGPRYRQLDVSSGLISLANSIGGSIEKVTQLRIQNQEVENKKLLFRAESKLALGMEELDGLLAKEKDPNKWEQVAADHMVKVRQGIDLSGATTEAQEMFDMMAERRMVTTVARARNNGFRANEQQLVTEALAAHDIAVAKNDPAGAVVPLKVLYDGGHIGDKEYEKRVMDGAEKIKAQRKEKLRIELDTAKNNNDFDRMQLLVDASEDLGPPERENIQSEIGAAQKHFAFSELTAANPNLFLQDIAAGKFDKDLTDKEKQEYTNMAFNNQQAQSAVLAERAVDEIFNKRTLTKQEQLDDPRWDALSPSRKLAIKKSITEGQPNDPAAWMDVANTITHFKLSGNTAEDQLKLSNLRSDIRLNFKGDHQDSLLKMVDGLEQPDAANSEVTKYAKQMATQAFSDGYLGNYKEPYREEYRSWGGVVTPGTPISPEDQARLKAGQIEAGKTVVVNQREQWKAQWRLNNILKKVDEMAKSGKSAEECEKYVSESVQQFRVAPAVEAASRSSQPPMMGGMSPALLPPADMIMSPEQKKAWHDKYWDNATAEDVLNQIK